MKMSEIKPELINRISQRICNEKANELVNNSWWAIENYFIDSSLDSLEDYIMTNNKMYGKIQIVNYFE